MWRLLLITLLTAAGSVTLLPSSAPVARQQKVEDYEFDPLRCYTRFCNGDKYAVVGTYKGNVYFWDTATGKLARDFKTYQGENRYIMDMVMTPDAKSLFVTGTDRVEEWDAAAGQLVQQQIWYKFKRIRRVVLSSDSRYLLLVHDPEIADEKKVRVQCYSRKARKIVRDLVLPYEFINWCTFSPNGKSLLIGGANGLVCLLDGTTGHEIRRFPGLSGIVTSVAFSPKGDYVVAGDSEKTACLWQTTTGQRLHTWADHEGSVRSIAISSDSRYVLTLSDTTYLREIKTGKLVHKFDGGFCTAFSPDAKTCITGDLGERAILWDVATGKQVHRFETSLRP